MVETLKARPNHYETLGIAPAASSEEIAKAFAREVNLIPLRPLGTFARVTAAYEALRDPVRRLAYDASLAAPPRANHSLIGRLERTPTEDIVRSEVSSPPPIAPRIPRSNPPPAPVPPPSVDAVHAPPKPRAEEDQPVLAPEPMEQQWSDEIDWHELERQERADRSLRPDVGGLLLNTSVAGALLLAIVLGAWTGFESGNDNDQAQQASTARLALPLDTAIPDANPPPADAPATIREDAPPEPSQPVPVAVAQNQPVRPPLQIELPDEPAPAVQPQASETPAAKAVAEPPPVAARTAKMPLPDAVIARTIGRIGYACGQVASIVPVEGEAPGTFRVTCTSGDSYRAAPVNGRYRFRRLGS